MISGNESDSKMNGQPMPADCVHQVGYIPDVATVATDWNERLAAFVAKVDDFNVRGQRDQINHPGHVSEFKFCPRCGQYIDRGALKLLTYSQAYELHIDASSSNKG